MGLKEDFLERIRNRIEIIRSSAKRNGYAGYDPYDILEHPLIRRAIYLRDGFLPRIIGPFAKKLVYHFPVLSRKILRIKPTINPKGVGLFAHSYLRLFELTGIKDYKDDAVECLNWLTRNYSKNYSGYAWGYPFDWQSRIFIPRFTPSAVVTVNIGYAFLKHYELTNDKNSLDIARSIALFLLNDLNIDEKDSKSLCFSYTPIDHFHVHNANIMTAAYMLELWQIFGEQVFFDYGGKALNYTLADQRDDGAFEYWGKEDRIESHIDMYHTGFVLRSLKRIFELTGSEKVKGALTRGCKFFIENFFTKDGIPKTSLERIYPVDIHAVAEAILVLSTVDEIELETRKKLLNMVFEFCDEKMWSKSGYYIYQLRGSRRIKIHYIRWSSAWMMRALVEYLGFLLERLA